SGRSDECQTGYLEGFYLNDEPDRLCGPGGERHQRGAGELRDAVVLRRVGQCQWRRQWYFRGRLPVDGEGRGRRQYELRLRRPYHWRDQRSVRLWRGRARLRDLISRDYPD